MIKKLIIFFAIALISTQASAAYSCGFKPFPPFGCSSNDAECICRVDSRGNRDCEWVFYCD